MTRSSFSGAERRCRSRIAQMVHSQRWMRGTLSPRQLRCGKPNCRCARGEPHGSLYLVQSHQGKPRQQCVPKSWQDRVRQAVNAYQEMQQLIEEVSEQEWTRLRHKKE